MGVYVLTLLSGYLWTGVDVTQGARAKIFRRLGIPAKYVFMEFPSETYVRRYEVQGIDRCDMISAPLFFTDAWDLSAEISREEVLPELTRRFSVTSVSQDSQGDQLYNEEGRIACITGKESGAVRSVQYYSRERLLMEEFYTDHVVMSSYYVTAKDKNGAAYARLALQKYRNRDGSTALEIRYDENRKARYLFCDHRLVDSFQFYSEFFRRLHLGEQDLVLIDRPLSMDFYQPLMLNHGEAKLALFLHSDHFLEKNQSPHDVNLNREYFALFQYPEETDYCLVSTWEQKEHLENLLADGRRDVPQVLVIPVGGMEKLYRPAGPRKKYSLLSVSRLDPRKKIDWMIQAAILAHKRLPQITLDFYGTGREENVKEYKRLVEEHDADSYIHFLGEQEVKEVYQNYEVFLSASTYETFGLTLLEAIVSGNAMIGFDVRYGNRLFIHPGENGLLLPLALENIHEPEYRAAAIERMADAIVRIFEDREMLEQYHENSYQIAQGFQLENLEALWMDFMKNH